MAAGSKTARPADLPASPQLPAGGSLCPCDDAGACIGPQLDIPIVFPGCNLDVCILLDQSGSIFDVNGAWDIETALVRHPREPRVENCLPASPVRQEIKRLS